MRRIFSVLAVAALLAAMMIGASAALAQEEPGPCYEVLHIPKGNPDNAKFIVVDPLSAESHVRHGDVLTVDPLTLEPVIVGVQGVDCLAEVEEPPVEA